MKAIGTEARVAARPIELQTVRVLGADMAWRMRRSDEQSADDLKVKNKIVLVLAIQVRRTICNMPAPAGAHSVPTPGARAQMARKKTAAPSIKKLKIDDVMIKRGAWVTSPSHVGSSWFELQCNNPKDEFFNGDIVKAVEALTDIERSKHVMPNLMSFNGVIEAAHNALLNGVLDAKHVGKGSSFGMPYPDGTDVDEVACRLYGTPALPNSVWPPDRQPPCAALTRPPPPPAVCAGTVEFQEQVVRVKGPDFDMHEFLGGALPYFLGHYQDKCARFALPSPAPPSSATAPPLTWKVVRLAGALERGQQRRGGVATRRRAARPRLRRVAAAEFE